MPKVTYSNTGYSGPEYSSIKLNWQSKNRLILTPEQSVEWATIVLDEDQIRHLYSWLRIRLGIDPEPLPVKKIIIEA